MNVVFVLIESDWNLKYYYIDKGTKTNGVLIESDWNLKNHDHNILVLLLLRINRIRLEFKVLQKRVTISLMIVLIESDWNLKERLVQKRLDCFSVLIESDWNLKYLSLSRCFKQSGY